MDGSPDPNDILRVLGVKELAKFMVNEIQEVYRLQGVKINDKHIEVIVRQMLRRVQITSVGDSTFMQSEHVEWWKFNEENEQLLKDGRVPAQAEALLLPPKEKDRSWCVPISFLKVLKFHQFYLFFL
jgi:DNA-directed RNA polymerase subunit beta'